MGLEERGKRRVEKRRELAEVELTDILLINYKKRCAWKVHDRSLIFPQISLLMSIISIIFMQMFRKIKFTTH